MASKVFYLPRGGFCGGKEERKEGAEERVRQSRHSDSVGLGPPNQGQIFAHHSNSYSFLGEKKWERKKTMRDPPESD